MKRFMPIAATRRGKRRNSIRLLRKSQRSYFGKSEILDGCGKKGVFKQ